MFLFNYFITLMFLLNYFFNDKNWDSVDVYQS